MVSRAASDLLLLVQGGSRDSLPTRCCCHAEAEAGNNGEARLLIVRSSDEISHDDR